jgi:hypothetical protein
MGNGSEQRQAFVQHQHQLIRGLLMDLIGQIDQLEPGEGVRVDLIMSLFEATIQKLGQLAPTETDSIN